MQAGRESGYRDRRSAGPGGGAYSPVSTVGSVRHSRRSDPPSSPNQHHSYQMQVPSTQMSGSVGSPNMSGNGGISSGGNGGLSNNVAYLSPPLDPSWRRTHSDSALHQAAMVSGESAIGNTSPNLSRRGISQSLVKTKVFQSRSITYRIVSGQDGINYLSSSIDPSNSLHLGTSTDGRPKSCCDVSRVPGIK